MSSVIKLALVAGTAALLAGCATVFTGTSQTVQVQAVNAKSHQRLAKAKCVVTDAHGVSYMVTGNPGQVHLPKVYGDLQVSCQAPGYYQKGVNTSGSFNAATLGDVLFWPGAIVDVATGAAKKYPSHITVLMSHQRTQHHVDTVKAG